NKLPKLWGQALHDEDLAEAIVDRILERGRLLRLDGPSVRTKHLSSDELAGDQDDSNSRRVSGKLAAEFPERTKVAGGRLDVRICVARRSKERSNLCHSRDRLIARHHHRGPGGA